MTIRALLLLAIGITGFGLAQKRAHACGGALVTHTGGTAAADAQRIYLSVGETSTEVVTVIRVPAAQEDFGVLLPLPALPTLDPDPVPTGEIDQLVRLTDPALYEVVGVGDGGGCGCGGLDLKSGAGAPRGPQVGPPVTIGPVTAVVLDASSATALEAWLAENAFTVPPAHQALIASHSGAGRAFVALRRTPTAAGQPTGATSVGVHFTLPGDQRGLPLRFARLGAGELVSFTVFVAAKTGVATALPFETITLPVIDTKIWRQQSYDAALVSAVGARGNHAFVVERRANVGALTTFGALGPRLTALTPASHTLTRLSTRVPAAALDTDVEFTVPAAGDVENHVSVSGLVRSGAGDRVGGTRGGMWALAAFGLAAALLRRPLRRPVRSQL